MSNPIHDAIRKSVLEPALKERLHTVKGRVLDYDNINNLAVVEISNPHGAGKKTISGVPVQIVGGHHQAGPFKDDHVWVSFMGGNLYYPRVTSIADEVYTNTTRPRLKHTRQGAYIPDSYTR